MMKKLLIILSVLALASMVNAALVLSFNGDIEVEEVTVDPSTYFIVDVYQTEALPDAFWLGIAGPADYDGYGTLYSPPATPTLVLSDGGFGAGWIQARMTSPSVDGDVGKWFEIELHCSGPGDVIVDLYNAGGGQIIDTLIIHQTPEPMTMALLGLGGLFLRRRK